MKYRLIDHLVCPDCRSEMKVEVHKLIEVTNGPQTLTGVSKCRKCYFKDEYNCARCIGFEIKEGELTCPEGKKYAIRNFVARFADEAKASDTRNHFEAQWKYWGDEKRIFGKTKNEMLDWCLNHLVPSDIDKGYFTGKLILDAGCGHGLYSEAFCALGACNEVIGMDITEQVSRNYIRNMYRYPLLHFVQGDILNPPFKESTFNYVFSEGVIHHTVTASVAFSKLFKLVKSGGILGIWVYPIRSKTFEVTTKTIRIISTRLPQKLLYGICLILVPLLSVIKAYSGTSLNNSKWRQCAQVIFDFLGPKYQTHHTEEEVRQWFIDEGAKMVEFFYDEPISAAGIKM